MELADLHRRSVESWRSRLEAVDDSQWSLPTPCTEWDVRALVNHVVSEELYFFTAGSGKIRVGAEERNIREGDCVVLPPGTEHKLWNTGDVPLQLLCCCAPAYSDDDTVITE